MFKTNINILTKAYKMQSIEKQIRLPLEVAGFLKEKIIGVEPTAKVFLFGSRTDLNAKGGDIDILVIADNPIPRNKLAPIRSEFFTTFGWQKLDIVIFKPDDQSPFYKIISPTAILL